MNPDEPQLRELRTDDGVLRYRESGEGPPLVLLHGSGPGATGWQSFSGNLPALARHFRTFILELPGFGVSDDFGSPNPFVSAQTALRAFLNGLDLKRVRLLGCSMGGCVAMDFAAECPDRVARLVTVGGAGASLLAPIPGDGIVRLAEFVEDPTRERLVAWLDSMVFDKSLITSQMIEDRWAQVADPHVLPRARTSYGLAALKGVEARFRDPEAVAGLSSLCRVQAPTLLAWGRDDRVSPLATALLPLRLLPRAELHVFPECGHWVTIEQKAAFESVVIAFLMRD